MERLGRLSLLWASISVASWLEPIAGSQPMPVSPAPPAPTLSLSPSYAIFTPGEEVQLTCSPPDRQRAAEFLFYRRKPDGQWALQIQQEEDSWEVPRAHLESQNTFVCAYNEKNSAGEPLQSAQSNPREVSIVPELPAAALSLDPEYPVYLQGERVTLACSAPEGLQVAGYIFYKERQDRTLKKLPVTGQGPYKAFEVDRNTTGKYRCIYWTLHSGRKIPSPHSGLVSVAMTKRPLSPIFSVSPKREVYGSGDFINLTCLAPDSRRMSKITFQLPFKWLPSSPDSFTYSLRLLPENGGKYSCTYQVVESGREILSPESKSIRIYVMDGALPLPLVAGCSGAGVLFLGFLICLFRKKRKGNSRRPPRSFWKSLEDQHSRRLSRTNHPSGTHLDLQEKAKPQVNQDWGILPKSKPVPPKCGDPAKQNQTDNEADSGSEFELPDIDPTYTLLGYPCSTFFQAESNPPVEDTCMYQKPL